MLETIGLTVTSEDSADVVLESILHEHEYVAYVEMVMDSLVVLDSLDTVAEAAAIAAASATVVEPDSAIADSVITDAGVSPEDPETLPDSEAVRRRGPPDLDGRSISPPSRGVGPISDGGRQVKGPDGEQLPARRIVVLLEDPLVPSITYQLVVSSLENLYGLPLGGGETSVALEPTAIADTAAVPDSIPVPDTGVVDTALVGVGR